LTFLFEKSENAYSLKKYELSGAVTKEGGTFFVLPSTFEDPFLVVRSALSHSFQFIESDKEMREESVREGAR
jgi:hypothetical protein